VFYVNMTNGCIHSRALEKKTLHTKQRNINVVEDNQIHIQTKLVSIIIINEKNRKLHRNPSKGNDSCISDLINQFVQRG
jgi:hypothetical protein